MLLVLALALPLLGGAVLAGRPRRRLGVWGAVGSNGAAFLVGVAIAVEVGRRGAIVGAGGLLRADALSAFMVVVVAALALLASWVGVRALEPERSAGRAGERRATAYGVLVQAFVATMLLAVLAANLGVLWVAVEATTVVTTFLVGHRRTRGALEASWKYLVICSVGIALAFLGTVLVYLAALHGGGRSAHSLGWVSLMAEAGHLDPSVMRLGFALVVLGYGTKVGLVPMHSWLPDAHSQAPAPISALMSGVLLSVALYAILRFKAIADLALGPGFSRDLLACVSLLSLALAASLLLAQRDYKRMLAYSSIEHMGLVALGAAAGTPLAVAGLLLHVAGHGLAKSVAFLTSGEIMAAEGTSRIDGVRALLARRPVLGGMLGASLLALFGLPPFSLFTSELLMARAEFAVGLGWAAVAAGAATVVVFLAVAGHARHMLLGPPAGAEVPAAAPPGIVAPLAGALVLCAVLGVGAFPLSGLLQEAARVVAR